MIGRFPSKWKPILPTQRFSDLIKRPLTGFCHHGSLRAFDSGSALNRKWKKKPSFEPSLEQQKVVKLCAVQNVVVSARPGSGKTAVAEAIIATYPESRVDVVTFSKSLELANSRRLYEYSNCKTFTFHKLATLLFGDTVHNDAIFAEHIERARLYNMLPEWKFDPFEIIVLDEFQGCTNNIFWLINCFTRANNQKLARLGRPPARLVVVGDERQSIYGYRGADQRYLTLADQLLGPVSPYPFANIPLSESFRLSKPSVDFINKAFLGGEPYITGSKPGPKPIVLRCYPDRSNALAKKIFDLIKVHGAENSAILSPSIRKNNSLKYLTNKLAEDYRIPIAVQTDDEVPLDKLATNGKMRVSNIHQFKGSERDLVILFGIDASYFKYNGRDLPDDRCPNDIFVALTRAAKQLVVIHDENQELMPFVSVDDLYETADIVNLTRKEGNIAPPSAPGRSPQCGFNLPKSVSVRDLTRHMPDEPLDQILRDYLKIEKLSPPLPEDEHIRIDNVVLSNPAKGFYEAVGDINGLAVTSAFEHHFTGTLSILKGHKTPTDGNLTMTQQQYVSWLCRAACKYEADSSGYRARFIQMKDHAFDWMKPEHLALAQSRLQSALGDLAPNLSFEVYAEQQLKIGNQETLLRDQADIVAFSANSDSVYNKRLESVWEIKFVSKLSNEHILQASIYAYLLTSSSQEAPRIMLFNLKDGEKLEIAPREGREGLRRMIESVLKLKYTTTQEMTNEEFVEMCAKATLEVSNLRGSDE
ncbi:hypothetical protein TRIATDRAFT_90556 [Trichoderma atroviride IMI 206040]|uniref:UvrD-like helicase C-terminal domain-containing protein n=1 Tax=Hypocrea atroviridis (strain ATCC 20476 / IMI 206040) TaxID=452589 RepID=G9NG30_HYPAI|nr:uncharacterized protein TRIATDRAFT_90556 [Trichoderma atroviride IMI 206040]EHK50242.1 hypothetical protein TRIATDRAFT_90556 [Trichoderma atroviride IMI 206040]